MPDDSATQAVGDDAIRTNHLILCEGKSDLYFLRAIIDRHKVPDVQVMPTGEGDSGFSHKLTQLQKIGQLDLVSSVLLVSDNDNNPDQKFKTLTNQVKDVGDIPIPRQRLRVAVKKGQPRIAMLMIPWHVRKGSMSGDREGDLETLILDVMTKAKPKVAKCVDSFVQCTPAKTWEVSPQSKMRLAAFISATCKKAPNCSTADMWQKNKKFRDLLDEPLFAPLVAYLKKLSTYVDREREEKLKLSLGGMA